jgi:ATP-binding cassette subfamily C (CFTR/MRP) protein 1
MLNDMKAVKMLGLEDKLSKDILHLRKLEMQGSENFRKLLVWSILLGKFQSNYRLRSVSEVLI